MNPRLDSRRRIVNDHLHDRAIRANATEKTFSFARAKFSIFRHWENVLKYKFRESTPSDDHKQGIPTPATGKMNGFEEGASRMDNETMIQTQIVSRGIEDPRVIDAMRRADRAQFVPFDCVREAYTDHPLPIGADQTISQPYIVALMTELLKIRANHRILEIGTGSGYQTAILAELAKEVFTLEIIEDLSVQAQKTHARLGYANIHYRVGDGRDGWKDAAPFDRIVLTAAPIEIPPALLDQLDEGGRLVAPVGPEGNQRLRIVERTATGFHSTPHAAVRFVPMTYKNQ
jgi:protein-L-isoaspartate(D-aspartate) O-methyltransferase